jgi:uncharacterized protein YbjT (DUF2867 family)
MKFVVFGGSGRIGSQVVDILRAHGHDVVSASPPQVDALKNLGVDEVLEGADVAVDVTNAMIFDEDEIVRFFTTTTENMLAAEERAGVSRHVVLSIVGVDRMNATSYLAGKVAQENAVRGGNVPYTIVRATQFQEFLPAIADMGDVEGEVRVPPIALQPIAAADVARFIAEVALEPAPEVVEIAGPERAPMAAFVRDALARMGDERTVVEDPEARYSGVHLPEDGLVPVGEYRTGDIRHGLPTK